NTQLCSTLPPPIPVSHTHLSEIAFVDTKLVFSAGWSPWAVAVCSLLDAAQYVSAVCVKEDGSLLLFLVTE
ncbi:MAG: hypothetical protein E6357_28745, partial [Clostridiales bacterium]|nr:hypothetical protein [Clostridiales bacterium]